MNTLLSSPKIIDFAINEPRHEKNCIEGFRPGPTKPGHTTTEDGCTKA